MPSDGQGGAARIEVWLARQHEAACEVSHAAITARVASRVPERSDDEREAMRRARLAHSHLCMWRISLDDDPRQWRDFGWHHDR